MSVWLILMVVNKCVVILLGHLTVAVMVDTYSLVMEELVLVHIQLLLDTSNTCIYLYADYELRFYFGT